MIKRIRIPGSNAVYLGTEGVFRKIINGQVYDMNPKTKKWEHVPQLSLPL